jgi:hypothetical protein
MDWRIAAAIVAGLVLASLADWLFAGVLFHERYRTYPEIWRINGPNPRAILIAQAMTVPTVAGLIALMIWSEHTSVGSALATALLVWAIVAVPVLVTNGIFVKIDNLVVASHTAGWLVKLVLVAAAASLILGL